MSSQKGSREVAIQPTIISANETERLEYLAALLLELVDEELRESEAPCIQN